MLFHSPEEIAKQATAAKLLPVSVVLLHLFTYAPDDMVPPHNARGWTLVEFSVRAPRHFLTGISAPPLPYPTHDVVCVCMCACGGGGLGACPKSRLAAVLIDAD